MSELLELRIAVLGPHALSASVAFCAPSRRTCRRVSFSEAPALVHNLPPATLPTPPYLLAHPRVAARVYVLAGGDSACGRIDPFLVWGINPTGRIWWKRGKGGDTSAGWVDAQPQVDRWDGDREFWGPEAGMRLEGSDAPDAAAQVHVAKFAARSATMRGEFDPRRYGRRPRPADASAPHPARPPPLTPRSPIMRFAPRSGAFYPALVRFVLDALASAPQPSRLDGLFWLGDYPPGEADEYADAVAAFVSAIRRDLDCPDLPFVCAHAPVSRAADDAPAASAAAGAADVEAAERFDASLSAACDRGVFGTYARCVPIAELNPEPKQVMLVGRRMSDTYWDLVSGRAPRLPPSPTRRDLVRPNAHPLRVSAPTATPAWQRATTPCVWCAAPERRLRRGRGGRAWGRRDSRRSDGRVRLLTGVGTGAAATIGGRMLYNYISI